MLLRGIRKTFQSNSVIHISATSRITGRRQLSLTASQNYENYQLTTGSVTGPQYVYLAESTKLVREVLLHGPKMAPLGRVIGGGNCKVLTETFM